MGSVPAPKTPWRETPLIESATLSRAAGCRIFLKLENLQPSSSFKSRGIGNLILSHVVQAERRPDADQRPLHFYSSSGGNAGLACVTAATTLGYKSTVVLPISTEQTMLSKLKAAGASEVISHGESWVFADEYLRGTVIPNAELSGETGIYVPPFDHPLVWEGASTMITEIQEQMPDGQRPDAIVCSVGGGGLLAGIIQGLDRIGWGDTVQVLAVETKGADSLAQSLAQHQHITLPRITSIATSLGATRVAEQAFQEAISHSNVRSVVLEDAEAVMGSWHFANDERYLVEPACGVSCALAYDGRLQHFLSAPSSSSSSSSAPPPTPSSATRSSSPAFSTTSSKFGPESKVVIIVCGGSRVTLDDLTKWKAEHGARAEFLAHQYRHGASAPR